MRKARWGSVAAACLMAGAAHAQPDALYQRFAFAGDGRWVDLALELRPGAWRIGSPDGPPADAGRLGAVLERLAAVHVGARCAGRFDGPTEYPCGFALARLSIDGIAAPRLEGIAGEGAATISIAGSTSEAAATEASIDGAAADHAVDVVARLTGPDEAGARLGGQLRFAFRAVPNRLAPSHFDSDSGVVVLRPGRRKRGPDSGASVHERHVRAAGAPARG